MKSLFKRAFRNIVFRLAATQHPLYSFYLHRLYTSKGGTIGRLIDDFSKSRERPVQFIQIGGNDGFSNDPIHKFIKRDGWKGLILEPLPDVFQQFLAPVYKKDAGVETMNAALGRSDGNATIYRIAFSDARWATGLTTFQRDVLEQAFASGHVGRKAKKEGLKKVPDTDEGILEETVEVVSFGTLMDRLDFSEIDLVQIDTEGFDFEVIQMIDFERVKPLIIIYEHIHLSERDKAACASYLAERDYKLKEFGVNTVATSPVFGKPL